jgi:hypothetical protein
MNAAGRRSLLLTLTGIALSGGCPGDLKERPPRAETGADGADLGPAADGLASGEGALADGAAQADSAASSAGCSDGTREGFSNAATYTSIAGCSGGWSVAGLSSATGVQCGRAAGNSSSNPTGSGCAADDLCSSGWHICKTSSEVSSLTGGSCTGITSTSDLFFATRQSGNGNALCESSGENDFFGCGTLGATPDATTCTPLDRFSGNLCASLTTDWSCGSDAWKEASNVTKSSASGGGVLCCKD